jgi:hypothetical protein
MQAAILEGEIYNRNKNKGSGSPPQVDTPRGGIMSAAKFLATNG